MELNFWRAIQYPIHWIPVTKMALLMLKCRVDGTVLLPSLVAKYAKLIVPSQKGSTFKRYQFIHLFPSWLIMSNFSAIPLVLY